MCRDVTGNLGNWEEISAKRKELGCHTAGWKQDFEKVTFCFGVY